MVITHDVKLSKTLSYWLRHNPASGGLHLDQRGWVDVGDVLAALARKGQLCDEQQLRAMVAANDKQRFEIDGNPPRIRARQGHSIQVEHDLQPLAPPTLLYHGTVERFLSVILAEGLKPMRRHHVHLSADTETAHKVGARRGRPVVLTVGAAAMHESGLTFFRSSNGVWLTDLVPPAFLTVSETARGA